jgi:hypothetical protein
MSLRLQEAFGLRREESIKIQARSGPTVATMLVLKSSMDQGRQGAGRFRLVGGAGFEPATPAV